MSVATGLALTSGVFGFVALLMAGLAYDSTRSAERKSLTESAGVFFGLAVVFALAAIWTEVLW